MSTSTQGSPAPLSGDKLDKPKAVSSKGIRKIFSFFHPSGSPTDDKVGNDDDDVPLSDDDNALSHYKIQRPPNVEDVAVPKADVVAVPSTITLNELIRVFKESERTRIPVYEETLDNPLGFVHLKDIALKYGFNGKHLNFKIRDDLRELMYVPPSMPIRELRKGMQEKHCHIALIIDEYGGVDGLVTIEDLLEHYFGEIIDEHDTQEENAQGIVELGGNSFRCPAKVEIEELEERLGVDLALNEEDDEIDTLGGWVSTKLNRIPRPGEKISFPDNGLTIRVVKGDARKMDLLDLQVESCSNTEQPDAKHHER